MSKLQLDNENSLHNVPLLMQRAITQYKCGDHSGAYNYLMIILKLEPDHKEAQVYAELIRNIFSFGNREVINV